MESFGIGDAIFQGENRISFCQLFMSVMSETRHTLHFALCKIK